MSFYTWDNTTTQNWQHAAGKFRCTCLEMQMRHPQSYSPTAGHSSVAFGTMQNLRLNCTQHTEFKISYLYPRTFKSQLISFTSSVCLVKFSEGNFCCSLSITMWNSTLFQQLPLQIHIFKRF
ncbi:transmembrane protein 63A [Platysternon megacephalum]|uniref:Transmembrane protein 63A n=1 Tax=Platysternon megacephalum TaxID=55544 RepID=A0A4D9ET49_9SAUR|nr:transmembrane protein 63A [Platysternon megacephalum]